MTHKEHIMRHKMLHAYLDELLADFLTFNNRAPLDTPLIEFLKWSYSQTIDPTEPPP